MQDQESIKVPLKAGKKMTKEKIIYKNQKRKVRNRLIYLVGLHIFFIFVFCGMMCVEYLIERSWTNNSEYYSLASDLIYLAYFMVTLVAIKFKHRKTLLASIFMLSLAIGAKTTCLMMLFKEQNSAKYLVLIHVLLLVTNFFIPLCLLFFWNKLKSDKWRQTFDMHTKLNNHLTKPVKKKSSTTQTLAE